jgi:radical SAM superfamily enzyme YgiQ (UPF0313 family)
MPDIVLSTLNARYIHAAFGLRYLLANLGELEPRATIVEFDIHQRPLDVAGELLACEPRIIGLGVYIWNVAETTALAAILKRLRPDIILVLGGPEVSYETGEQEVVRLADYVITGEADLAFAELCGDLLRGNAPARKVISAPVPEMRRVRLPYQLYTDEDIAQRVLYVEASRGCPFTCEFCLSSLDIPVRPVDFAEFLAALRNLLDRGARQFKFVDRTFNLNLNTSRAILEFLLDHFEPGMFFHFELVPDRLPDGLREVVKRFPPGALQFEVGIQTFNEATATLISRRQNYDRLADNLHFLRTETGVHVHADLIAGLPGESVESFGAGFDRLVALGPQEIQVGILKRLRGTPIVRHNRDWEMVYSPQPPYEVLRTRSISFADMQRLRRFARYWDLVGNSGHFVETTPLIWRTCGSPFAGFLKWSDWLYARISRTHGVALGRLMELLLEFLVHEDRIPVADARRALLADYRNGGHNDTPVFLSEIDLPTTCEGAGRKPARARRQQRHLVNRKDSKSRRP